MESASLIREKAGAGDSTAQYKLGLMYYIGQGVEQDDAEAVKWIRRAAEQGDALAQNNLGAMYYFGQGVEKDYVDAYAWFNLAAAHGYDSAAESRDKLEGRMSPRQVADAQKRTEELWKLIAKKQTDSK